MRRLLEHSSLQFRVLYRQSLLRVIDLEALSVHADIPRFLGQFAGVLIMFSLIQAGAAFMSGANATTSEARLVIGWRAEQWLISTMMLIVGLFVVFTWDSTFPDRRDAMVLSPLPVGTGTLLAAKVAASSSILVLAVVAFNFASGVAWPLVIGGSSGVLRLLAAYWFTMIAASAFLYGSVLTVQGLSALLLPHRLFLRFSAVLQITAFGLFLGVYFLQPALDTPVALAARRTQWILAVSPSFWFFALLNQLNGSLPPALAWLPRRAWIGLAIAVLGAATSLLLCYLHTMRKTIEEPDLLPTSRGFRWMLRCGTSLDTAVLFFTLRSLLRSRQHRLAYAFYLAVVFVLTTFFLRQAAAGASQSPMSLEFVGATFMMMCFAVVGMRRVFSLPVSLSANWVLRITQLRSSQEYITATRRSLLTLAVLPVWFAAGFLSLSVRPVLQIAAHLTVLALLGLIVSDISLIGFYKLPFTCSFLPGKANVQFMFWSFVIVFLPILGVAAVIELKALQNPLHYGIMMAVLGAVSVGLWALNRYRAKSAVLCFEEVPGELITTLGLTSGTLAQTRIDMDGSDLGTTTRDERCNLP
jgi:hypothetical protein